MRDNNYFFKCSASIGATAFLLSMPNTVVINNGAYWDFFNEYNYLKRINNSVENRFFNSELEDKSIIYGSESYITRCLNDVEKDLSDVRLLTIITDSASTLIGDDTYNISKAIYPKLDIITMDSGGLYGGFSDGFEAIAIKVIDKYASTNYFKENTINVLGLSDFYYNGVADREEICRILTKAGYELNVVLGGNQDIEHISKIGEAKLNIVCNEELGIKTAKYLKEKFGTPYIIVGLPYGLIGTRNWLQRINEILPAKNIDSIDVEIKEAERSLQESFDKYYSIYGNLYLDNVIIFASGTLAQCLGQCLRNELFSIGNMTLIEQTSVTQNYCDVADNILKVGINNNEIEKLFSTVTNCFVCGNGVNYLNLRNRCDCNFAFLNIQYPVVNKVSFYNKSYLGIKGTLVLIETIWNKYINSFN